MDDSQDKLSELLTEFEKIDYSPEYMIENGTAAHDKEKSSSFLSFKNLKIAGIYAAVFLIWSFILVAVFLPKYVYIDETFSWSRFFMLSILVFISLILFYYGAKWAVQHFIK